MQREIIPMNRRQFVRAAGSALAGASLTIAARARKRPGATISLFDGKSLRGWAQIENSAVSLSANQISDPDSFIGEIRDGADALSLFLRGQLDGTVQDSLATFSVSAPNAKAVLSAFIKNLNQVVLGSPIYNQVRFGGRMRLRPETRKLLDDSPRGYRLAKLNKMLIEDAYPAFIEKAALTGWNVKDGTMASLGTGRGVIYSDRDFGRFRLTFTMRHISGNPDHQACVLIFCTRPQGDEMPIDALGGIQFQVPNGGHWDYHPGMNNAGGSEFTTVTKTKFDVHDWSRVEILADASNGTARMAIAQPLWSKAIEVLDFKNAAAGKVGPIAWQMHNAGLFDEYRDVTIEPDPVNNDLITVG